MAGACLVCKLRTTIPNMGTTKKERGPVAERVAANVKALRKARGNMTLDELARRLRDLGHPILKSGLSKIETGERRVDVDDLVALAIALQVTPNRLLLTDGIHDEQIGLTGGYSTTDRAAWQWSCADDVHQVMSIFDERDPNDFRNPAGRWEGDARQITVLEFKRENRPHRPPVLLSPAEWREMKPFEDRITEIRNDVNEAGLNWRALIDAHDCTAWSTRCSTSGA